MCGWQATPRSRLVSSRVTRVAAVPARPWSVPTVATDLALRPTRLARGAERAWRPAAAALALITSLTALVVAGLVQPNWFGMIDLAVYRSVGAAVLHGQPLYSAHPAGSLLPFTYPPFAGLLFAPLAAASWPVAQVLAGLTWLACLTAVLVMCLAAAEVGVAAPRAGWRETGWQRAGWRGIGWRGIGWRGIGWRRGGWSGVPVLLAALAAAVWLEPVRGTLAYGQVNLLLVALVLADLTGRLERLPRGVLIGVAAGLKLTPGIFAVYLLLTGRPRAAGAALASFLGTVGLGWLLLPADSAQFWGKLWLDPGHVGGVPYAGNQSLYAALTRLLGGTHQAGLPWVLAAVLVGAGGLAVAAATHRAGQELAGIALCGLTGLLISPISWNHHWVWVLPGTVVAVTAAARRPTRGRLARLACWLAPFLVGPIWWVPHGGDQEYHHHGLQLLLGNAYLLAGLGALGLAAARVVQRRWTTPADTRFPVRLRA
jgi:alpha-1,2-mannosyltransferase